MATHRFVVWEKEAAYGSECVSVTLERDRLTAAGLAIGWEPLAYQLEFTLETGPAWITRRLRVTSQGQGWRRTLDITRSPSGVWSVESATDGELDLPEPGGAVERFGEALDCDLGLSPLTNTMPVLRHDLLRRDGMHDFVMAWVSVPGLSVHASAQRYRTSGKDADGRRIIEYSSIGRDFVSDLTFDSDGLVVGYPSLARRVPAMVPEARAPEP